MVVTGTPQGNESTDTKLIPGIRRNQEALKSIPMENLIEKSGARHENGRLLFDAFFQTFEIDPESFSIASAKGEPESLLFQSIALRYLATSDGTPPSGTLIHFRELPGGGNYASAFQGYAPNSLARHFGQDMANFSLACRRIGGAPVEFGDAAFAFDVFPKIRITVIYYLGEEMFPPGASLLFDSSVSHYMVTDGLATIGKRLVDIIIGNSDNGIGA